MKKQIDINDSIIKDLKIAAAWRGLDLKNYIQEVLNIQAQKSILYNQNINERTACKYLDPVLEEFEKIKLNKSKLHLKVVTEGSFVYEISDDLCTHQISVINDNMDFFDNMTISEILYKTPFYFSHTVFYNNENNEGEEVFCFRIVDTEEWVDRFGSNNNL
jgi:hypothetical protein